MSRASATKESSPPDTRTVGNIVHHALEHIDFAAIDPADEAALDVQVERSMEAQRAGTDTTLAASAKRRMKLVLASPLPNILVAARNLRRELNFRMLWPPGETDEPVEIVGVIDGLYQDSQDRWHIYDYKITGQTAKEDADLADRYELQIFLYAMAIERALGIRPASAELIRLDNELTRVPVPLDEERLYEAEERIDRAILNLKSGNDEPPS